jgi:alpha-glucosidase
MDLRKVFTLDPLRYQLKLFQEVVSYLHSHNQYHVMMVDPAVAYQNYPAFNNGVADDAFLKFSNGSIYQGVVWPGVTAFPDWFGPKTQEYWNNEFTTFFNPTDGVDIDGLWIDMNEASNFCPYPCSNPAATAIANGDPPTPPPVRLTAPRPIPGFGPDFQPKCVSTVLFDVYAETYYGENILILGNSITLGDGSVQNAAAMNANNYPHWQATIQIPPNGTFSYEYVRKESGGSYIYEAQNRTITTGDCHSGVQSVHDTITTSSGPHKRSDETGLMPLARSPMPVYEPVKRDGSMLGLPNRNLISPPYHINNTAGSLSQATINTDLIHANGLTEYDTHNLYGTMMSASSRNAMLNRRPGLRPLV